MQLQVGLSLASLSVPIKTDNRKNTCYDHKPFTILRELEYELDKHPVNRLLMVMMATMQRRWVRGADAGRGPSVCFTRSTLTSGLVSKKPPQKQTSLMLAPLKQAPHLGCRERKIKSMFMLLLNCPTGEGGIMLEGEQLVWLDQWSWSYNIKIWHWQSTNAQLVNICPMKICHVSVLWTKLVNCL